MIEFAVKTSDGAQIVGLALTEEEIEALKTDRSIFISMEKHGVGLWRRGEEHREFLQPRMSHIFVVHAEDKNDLARVMGLETLEVPPPSPG